MWSTKTKNMFFITGRLYNNCVFISVCVHTASGSSLTAAAIFVPHCSSRSPEQTNQTLHSHREFRVSTLEWQLVVGGAIAPYVNTRWHKDLHTNTSSYVDLTVHAYLWFVVWLICALCYIINRCRQISTPVFVFSTDIWKYSLMCFSSAGWLENSIEVQMFSV